jgi:Cu+-exporting ATPase
LGGGVSGTVDGHTVSVGSRDFLRRENIMALEDLSALAAPFQDEGNRVVYVALQGQPAGILVVADKVKSTVAVEIRALQALGLKLVMLTGDDRLTAEHVAGNLDLDEVQAGLGSAEKAAYVARRCATGEHLAAFGHGLTDGPVLQAADVGLAMGSGARLLLPEADITLLQGDLAGVARAIQLSRALRRIIRQNYFLVFLYNACGIPIAAGALYPVFGLLLSPFIVGSVIGFSSVSVISNALRLREVKL